MFVSAALGILICMVLALTRALLGPTVYDRILDFEPNFLRRDFSDITIQCRSIFQQLIGGVYQNHHFV